MRLLAVGIGVIVASVLGLLAASARTSDEHTLIDKERNRSIVYRVWPGSGDGPRPLILLSHGSGGDYGNHLWLITALQTSGYTVAALNHPFDTSRNRTAEGVTQLPERAEDMTALLDLLLDSPTWAAAIDSSRIGAAGFSSGGYAVLALAGAVFNRDLMTHYCNSDRRGRDCDLAPTVPANDGDGYPRAGERTPGIVADHRIKAVFAMAPAVAQGVELSSLQAIETPVYIIAANDDEIVPPPLNASVYRHHIPGAEAKLIDRGGHFVFLQCDLSTWVADFFIESLNLCGRGIDVDRQAIQKDVARMAVAFFEQHLNPRNTAGRR